MKQTVKILTVFSNKIFYYFFISDRGTHFTYQHFSALAIYYVLEICSWKFRGAYSFQPWDTIC